MGAAGVGSFPFPAAWKAQAGRGSPSPKLHMDKGRKLNRAALGHLEEIQIIQAAELTICTLVQYQFWSRFLLLPDHFVHSPQESNTEKTTCFTYPGTGFKFASTCQECWKNSFQTNEFAGVRGFFKYLEFNTK